MEKNKFQGHAAPVRYLEDVDVINQLSQSPPWSTATSNPCAYRLKINAAAGSMSQNDDKVMITVIITIGKVEMTKKQPYLKVVATGTIRCWR